MDVAQFLALPLLARVAANGPNGPTVRPVWFLYEAGTFWWLTGSYSRLEQWLEEDPRVSIVVDTCDLATGEVKAVTATGQARIHPLDPELAGRKLARYLGPDMESWPKRFRAVLDDSEARLVSLRPNRPPRLRDLSFDPSAPS